MSSFSQSLTHLFSVCRSNRHFSVKIIFPPIRHSPSGILPTPLESTHLVWMHTGKIFVRDTRAYNTFMFCFQRTVVADIDLLMNNTVIDYHYSMRPTAHSIQNFAFVFWKRYKHVCLKIKTRVVSKCFLSALRSNTSNSSQVWLLIKVPLSAYFSSGKAIVFYMAYLHTFI